MPGCPLLCHDYYHNDDQGCGNPACWKHAAGSPAPRPIRPVGCACTKEKIFDEHIAPILREVLRLADEYKIATLIGIALDDPADPESEGLRFSAVNLTDETNPPHSMVAASIIYQNDVQPIVLSRNPGPTKES